VLVKSRKGAVKEKLPNDYSSQGFMDLMSFRRVLLIQQYEKFSEKREKVLQTVQVELEWRVSSPEAFAESARDQGQVPEQPETHKRAHLLRRFLHNPSNLT
jgi:hypothetical protein